MARGNEKGGPSGPSTPNIIRINKIPSLNMMKKNDKYEVAIEIDNLKEILRILNEIRYSLSYKDIIRVIIEELFTPETSFALPKLLKINEMKLKVVLTLDYEDVKKSMMIVNKYEKGKKKKGNE